MLIHHSVFYFSRPGKTPQVKAEHFKSRYFCLAKANYVNLMTPGSYLRNYITVVVKSATLCTAVVSCIIFRGQRGEWGSPTLWPLHCLRVSFCRERGQNTTRVAKKLGKADEYWQLRSRLAASYDDLKHTKILSYFFLNKQLCLSRQKEAQTFNWRILA